MISIKNLPSSYQKFSTLANTSYYEITNNDGIVKKDSLINDNIIKVLDFDAIKNEYLDNEKKLSVRRDDTTGREIKYLKSVDALYTKDDDIYLIEFKAGIHIKPKDIKEKFLHSYIIIMDILDVDMAYIQNNIISLTVFSESKHNESRLRERNDNSQRLFLFDDFYKLGYFKEVLTISDKEFKNTYLQSWT